MHRVVFLLAIAAAAIFAGSAAATPPDKTHETETMTATLSGACSFDVAVVSSVSYTKTLYFDRSGALIRLREHATTQDTFSANGKTLIGLPFTFNVDIFFDAEGNLHFYGTGVAEKIRLPDGTLFVSAGRTDMVALGLPEFALSPQKGNPGDVAAFCAALS